MRVPGSVQEGCEVHALRDLFRQELTTMDPLPPPSSPFSFPGRGNWIIAGRGTIEHGGFWDGLLGTWEAFTKGHFLDFVDDHDVGK